MKQLWHVYILLCDNGHYYTGITTDLQRRLAQHAHGKGAKYTRSHGASKILYFEKSKDRSSALKREAAIKKLSHLQKETLCSRQ